MIDADWFLLVAGQLIHFLWLPIGHEIPNEPSTEPGPSCTCSNSRPPGYNHHICGQIMHPLDMCNTFHTSDCVTHSVCIMSQLCVSLASKHTIRDPGPENRLANPNTITRCEPHRCCCCLAQHTKDLFSKHTHTHTISLLNLILKSLEPESVIVHNAKDWKQNPTRTLWAFCVRGGCR